MSWSGFHTGVRRKWEGWRYMAPKFMGNAPIIRGLFGGETVGDPGAARRSHIIIMIFFTQKSSMSALWPTPPTRKNRHTVTRFDSQHTFAPINVRPEGRGSPDGRPREWLGGEGGVRAAVPAPSHVSSRLFARPLAPLRDLLGGRHHPRLLDVLREDVGAEGEPLGLLDDLLVHIRGLGAEDYVT